MPYEYISRYDSPNQHGSNDVKTEICIHHWGGDGQSFNAVVNWLCNPRAQASAHFVAEAGRVACLVNMDRIAWHAGPGNMGRVGIECRPEMSSGDLETVAELVALIWHWCPHTKGKRLRYHSQFMNTACPGRWKNKLEWVRQRAEYYYPLVDPQRPGVFKNKPAATAKPAVKPVAKPAVKPSFNVEQAARDVIAGKYGNGDERKRRLGANYAKVQARVNQILLGKSASRKPAGPTTSEIDRLADAVIRGEYGNGAERQRRLGSKYAAVQKRVNQKLGVG